MDYQSIKANVKIEDVARFLDLELKKYGQTFRCACPACNQGGDRAIVITPAKQSWFCFALKKGGDAIYLVAHIKGIKQSEAAKLLQEEFMREEPAKKPKPQKERAGGTAEYTIVDHLSHWR